MTHTPGKWFVEFGSGSLPYRVITTLDKTLVAATEYKADAELIASAPELLEQLKQLKEEITILKAKLSKYDTNEQNPQ